MRGALSRLRFPCRHEDGGSMLTELIVALVVFSITATGLATLAISMIKKTASTSYNATAAALLTKDLDIARAVGAANLPKNNAQTLISTETIGGQRYETWRRVVDWGPDGGACGVAAATSKRVTTVIKWTEILGQAATNADTGVTSAKTTKSISGSTIMTPLPGTLLDGTGSYGVTVKDQNSKPLAGVKVNFTTGVAGTAGTQLVTDTEGCALIGNLTAGSTWTAWLGDQPTYVPLGYRYVGDPAITSKTNSIPANAAATAEFVYAKSAKLTLGVDTDNLHPLPTNIPFAVGNSAFSTSPARYWTSYTAGSTTTGSMYLPGSAQSAPLSTSTTVFPYLFPSTLGYEPWLGLCADNDPGSGTGKRGTAVVLRPGTQNSTGTAKAVKVDLTLTGLDPTKNLTVVLKHNDTANACPEGAGQSYVIAPSNVSTSTKPTGSTQVVRFAMPFGSWNILVTANNKPAVTIPAAWDGSSATTQAITKAIP